MLQPLNGQNEKGVVLRGCRFGSLYAFGTAGGRPARFMHKR